MDDAAAASASKKRKRDEPEAQDPPATRDGGGDEGLDLISRLPDELLGTIISLLPRTKEAARTAILSSRWRHIWRTTPLNLVARGLSGQERKRVAIVSKILAAHPGPARRLALYGIRLGRERYAKFNGWFRSPALDGLEELGFTSSGDAYSRNGGTRPPRPLPPSVLRFAPTLRAVSIGRCDFPEINAAPALVLPRLKQLNLYDVVISEAAIHRLLAGCIVLERLQLQSLRGLSIVRIVSPTLRSIDVSVCSHPEADVLSQQLVIEDAPCLERLISWGPVGGPKTIRVIVAPKSHAADFPEINATPALLLPRLKQLNLYGVVISEVDIHRLLASCIVLEALDLHSIRGLSTVRIFSPTLRSIGISVYSHSKGDVFQELVIEDAPCLERLISFNGNGPRTIRVIGAPKLTVLGYVCNKIFKLEIGTTIVKEMIPINFTLPVRTVKILALESIGPNLDAVVGLLRCFPCTEKIYIQSLVRKDMKNVWQHDILDPIECLVHHLGKIVLEGYVGMRPDVNFAKFFVLNARVLKVMIFGLSDDRNEEWMANQHRRLQLDNRASRNARFDFKRVNGNRNMHIHDMRMPDPFDS
ncbi:putative F-box/LRR-repeat protein At5g02700 [Aegilops tauschii subsp. strangulata]|nr:putative F-box/LRR-repeat protein At5g02700 [Aegilops tauschii subsp. strangulata]XP_044401841.1 putative F-box/LRR-repeat protein At5g02700 [Triticum aestivum]